MITKARGYEAAQLANATRSSAAHRKARKTAWALFGHRAEKSQHGAVEKLGPLNRSEMTHTRQIDKFSAWDTLSEIFGMLALDELIPLAMDDRHRNADPGQIPR